MYLALTVSITMYSYMTHSPALNVETVSSCEMLVKFKHDHMVSHSRRREFWGVTVVQKLLEKQALKWDKLQ